MKYLGAGQGKTSLPVRPPPSPIIHPSLEDPPISASRSTTDSFVHVHTVSALERAVEDLGRHPGVAVDLEADSMFHFKEKICLIQMRAGTASYIIDPIMTADLSPLGKIFANPSIRKILHGADYDVRSLYRDYGFTIENLFDTELASRFLGKTETGLNSVLTERFGVKLEKKYQKKDWSQRPLPVEMLAYAAKDVEYLIPLHEVQIKELKDLGRLEWVLEECRDLTQVRAAPANERPLFLKVKGAGRLEPRTLAILESLLEFRLTQAEAKDRPPFKIMGNHSLLAIAGMRPVTMGQLTETGALSEKQLQMYGHSLLTRVREALALPADALPRYPRIRHPRISQEESERVKLLRQWREKKAGKLCIDPGVLINNAAISAIAGVNPQTPEDLDRVSPLKNWQKTALGPEILKVLKT